MRKKPLPIWLTEPSELAGECSGLRWHILRHPTFLTLCGYVAVWPPNLFFNLRYDAVVDDHGRGPPVHGGLTYSGATPGMGNPDGAWWFGFDCAHFMDRKPGIERILADMGHTDSVSRSGVYRDMPYVQANCEQLADWLATNGNQHRDPMNDAISEAIIRAAAKNEH